MSDGNIIQKGTFQRKREFKHGVVYGIVKLAEDVAKEQGAPYFTVVNVQSPVERTWRFSEKDEFLSGKIHDQEDKYSSIIRNRQEPPKPIEFVLHPTAQLYVPRK